jgi:hypothetical protein
MSVRFTIRGNDLWRLQDALDAHRPSEGSGQWIVFLEVTPSIAFFRFGGKEERFPVDGKSPGFAKFPAEILRRFTTDLLPGKPKQEVLFEISEGLAECDRGRVAGEVEVGYFRCPDWHGVFYIRDVELASLADFSDEGSAFMAALRPHIKDAAERTRSRVSFAAHQLAPCSFTFEEVSELVETRIAEIGPQIRARIDALERSHGKAEDAHA